MLWSVLGIIPGYKTILFSSAYTRVTTWIAEQFRVECSVTAAVADGRDGVSRWALDDCSLVQEMRAKQDVDDVILSHNTITKIALKSFLRRRHRTDC